MALSRLPLSNAKYPYFFFYNCRPANAKAVVDFQARVSPDRSTDYDTISNGFNLIIPSRTEAIPIMTPRTEQQYLAKVVPDSGQLIILVTILTRSPLALPFYEIPRPETEIPTFASKEDGCLLCRREDCSHLVNLMASLVKPI
jgi:hypothetical protein